MLRLRRFRSRRVRAERRERVFHWVELGLALVGAIVLLVSQLSMIPGLTITQIQVEGEERVPAWNIYVAAKKEMKGLYGNLFAKTNSFFYPKDAMAESVQAVSPRIKGVKIKRDGMHHVNVTVEERESIGAYCNTGRCFHIDDTGFVFATSKTTGGSTFFSYSGVIEGDPIGQNFLPEQKFVEVNAVREALKDLRVETVALAVSSATSTVVGNTFDYKTKEGAQFLFSDKYDFEEQIANLKAVLDSDEYAEEAPNGFSDIEYIDLRFGSKVFYRIHQ